MYKCEYCKKTKNRVFPYIIIHVNTCRHETFLICADCFKEACKYPIKLAENKDLGVCQHLRQDSMTWPDGGESVLCLDCFMTCHHTEFDTTEWQDHNYKSKADWYKEAAELDEVIERIKK